VLVLEEGLETDYVRVFQDAVDADLGEKLQRAARRDGEGDCWRMKVTSA